MAVRLRSSRERLQDLLETLRPGDEIQAAAASQETGIDATMCESVLDALVRVGLFTRSPAGVFVRQRMFDVLGRPQVYSHPR